MMFNCLIMRCVRFVLLLTFLCAFATLSFPQKKRTVLLEQCDELTFDKQGGRSYQVLRGNVRFRHEDVLMYCDSAYFYDGSSNSFDAFGHVRVVQTGGATMVSDSLFYDGQTTLMRIRGAVELRSESSTLKTHFLDFFRNKNYGYYYGGGDVVDADYHLTSRQGYYYTEQKSYLFKDSVVLVHPEYTILADSLRYSQGISKATLLGPSIVAGQKYKVNTTKGWIITNTNVGRLYNRSVVTYQNGKRMTADSIAFNAKQGKVKAYGKAEVCDTVQKMIVRGEYMEGDSTALAYATVVGNPYVVEYSEGDSLYLKADTLHLCEVDSVRNELRAYRNVCIYRSDMQGKCDSLVYFSQDSLARMYYDPVIWSEQSQLMGGDRIDIHFKNEELDRIHIPEKAMIVSDEGENQYNQLSGKEAVAYVVNNKLQQVDLLGEAVSLYYSKDDRGLLVGLNKAVGQKMSIFTKKNKLHKIIMTPDSEGIMYPPDKIPEEERFLRNFKWRENERPKSRDDFFNK